MHDWVSEFPALVCLTCVLFQRVRRPFILDLACGHGLCGLLFASLETSVEKVRVPQALATAASLCANVCCSGVSKPVRVVRQVLLVDARRPASYDAVLAAIARAAPWVLDKVRRAATVPRVSYTSDLLQ